MTTIDCSTLNKETLAHLVLINQMAAATSCTHEQAKQLLILTEWRLDVREKENSNKLLSILNFSWRLIYFSMNEQCRYLVVNFPK